MVTRRGSEQAFGRYFADGLYRGLVSSATQANYKEKLVFVERSVVCCGQGRLSAPQRCSVFQRGVSKRFVPELGVILPVFFCFRGPYFSYIAFCG